jgi:minor extracellular serine protease Vpr
MNWKKLTLRFYVLALVTAFAVPVQANDIQQLEPITPAPILGVSNEMVDETPNLWFVELANPPKSEGTSNKTLSEEKAQFRAAAKKAGIKYSERFTYDNLFNGFSIQVNNSLLPALSRVNGVKAIWPVVSMDRPASASVSEPDLATALVLTGADTVQSELGYTGKGIKVAVMDTGIDYHHPDLGGCSKIGPDCRVVTGYDFVGDNFDAATATKNNPIPDNDPEDCEGHGTHVAGIIGANGKIKGVAPDVTFGAYRVFGCEGSTSADIMIAAMERALADGMQVLNMSIGSAFQWPNYPTAAASNRAVNKGMVVVASIGNSGTNGLYSAGAPGLGEKVIGVASYDNSHVDLQTFKVNQQSIGYMPATDSASPPTSGEVDLVRTGTPTIVNDACGPLPEGSLTGKVALIRRGTCTFYIKAHNAQAAGAVGVVLYNNAPGRFSATVTGVPAIQIPVVAISDSDGVTLNNRLANGTAALTWTNERGTFPNPTGGLISSFSSYGLSPDLTLKPDIGAPGGLIRSTYPLNKGGYATLSGTSMSSPHVAGAVALLLEARPKTSSQEVRSILQNTAEPKNWWGNPGLGYLDQVHRQGAGMVRIDKAILATTRVEPAKLSLGESEVGPVSRTLTISNNGSSDVTYKLSHAPALSTNGNTFSPGATTGFATVSFSAESVTVPAGGIATVNVTVTANAALPDRSMYGGYIVLMGDDDQTYRVPYAGFKGDYQSIPAMTGGGNGFPWLVKFNENSYEKQGEGAAFTMSGDDIPYFFVHLDHQVSRLRLEVRDAVTGKSWHRASDDTYIARNSSVNGFFALPFDGVTIAGNKTYEVPNGKYEVVISALKALGDENNPAHWETWTSPVFTVARTKQQ